MKNVLTLSLIIVLCCPMTQGQQLTKWKQRLASTGFSVGINPLNPNSVYAQNGAGTFLVSYNLGITWEPRGAMPAGQIRQIIVHPLDTTLILCAAFSGGLHRSTNYGLTWTTVLPNFGIDGESIALNPIHPDTIYAGDFFTSDVFLSTNRGATWTQTGTVGGSICAFIVRPDSTNILYAGAGVGRIAKTTDHGATWRVVKPEGSEEIPKIVIDRFAPLVAYGAGYDGPDSTKGVWKTTDGGEHWSRTTLQARSIWSLDIDNANPSIIYAGTFAESIATVFVTSDGGNSWISHNAGIPPFSNAWNIKSHPLDGGIVWLAEAGTKPGIYQHLSTRTIVQGIVLDDATGDTVRNGRIINTATHDTTSLASSGGEFAFGFFTGDSNMTPVLHVEAYPYYVTDIPASFIQDSTVAHAINLHRLPTATIAGTLRDSVTLEPVSARVTLIASTIMGPVTIFDSTDQSGAFEFDNLYISQPGVVHYDRIDIDPVFPYPHHVVPSFTLSSGGATVPLLLSSADVLLVAGDSIRFAEYYKSALDSIGVSWNLWDRSDPAPLSRVSSFRKNTIIYYTGNRNTPFAQSEMDSLMACIANGGNLLLTGQNISEKNDTTNLLRNVIGVQYAGTPGTLPGITGVSGDLFSTLVFGTIGSGGANNQASRDRVTVTGPQTRACLTYSFPGGTAGVRRESNGRRIIFLGFGFEGITTPSARRSVMQRIIGYLDGSITVSVDDAALSPFEYHLDQNYPNPFNPSTTIRYSVPHDATVALEVYNLLGQKVATLVENERKRAGVYDVMFSAASLSSGVYLYRMTAGSYIETRKLIILK